MIRLQLAIKESRSGMFWTVMRAVIVAAVLATVALVATASIFTVTAASAAVTPPYQQPTPVTSWNTGTMGGSQWMVKANDYAEFPAAYGNWAWMMCGQTVVYGSESDPNVPDPPETGPCEPGQAETFADITSLLAYVASATSGVTIVFDPETWAWTPKWEQAHQARYIQRGCVAAKAKGDTIIVTPEGPKPQLTWQYQAGAKFCTMVEVQSQGAERNYASFTARVSSFLRTVRAYPNHAGAMVGLATDPGGHKATQAELSEDYAYAHGSEAVGAFWMNADAWTGEPYMDGTGDAAIAQAFFTSVGYTP